MNLKQNFYASFLFFVISLKLTISEQIKVDGQFDYCLDSYHKTPIDRDNVCQLKNYHSQKKSVVDELNKVVYGAFGVKTKKDLKVISVDVFTKENITVEGVGYECEMKIDHWSFGLTFFGYKWQTVVQEVVQLQPKECAKMIQSNECDGKTMKCADGICEFRESVVDDYSYFYTVKKDIKTCIVKKRTITAKNKEAFLFGSKCTVTDYSCRMLNSIIIWDKHVLQTCPFKRFLKAVDFTIRGTSLHNDEHGLLLKMRNVETNCNTQMIRTFEGAYIMRGNNEEFYLKTSLPDTDKAVALKEFQELNMASLDYIQYKQSTKNRRHFSRDCQNFKYLLQQASSVNDRYFKFNDFNGAETIIYSLYGELYKTSCNKITEIYIDTNITDCYLDFQVTATINNRNRSAFLTHYGIVKTHSQKINCLKETIRKIKIPNTNKMILNKNNVQQVVDEKDFQLEKLTFLNFEIDKQINHDYVLRESMYNMFHEYDNKESIENIFIPTENKFNGSEESLFSFRLIGLLLVIVLLSLIVLIQIYSCLCNWKNLEFCSAKRKIPKRKRETA